MNDVAEMAETNQQVVLAVKAKREEWHRTEEMKKTQEVAGWAFSVHDCWREGEDDFRGTGNIQSAFGRKESIEWRISSSKKIFWWRTREEEIESREYNQLAVNVLAQNSDRQLKEL